MIVLRRKGPALAAALLATGFLFAPRATAEGPWVDSNNKPAAGLPDARGRVYTEEREICTPTFDTVDLDYATCGSKIDSPTEPEGKCALCLGMTHGCFKAHQFVLK